MSCIKIGPSSLLLIWLTIILLVSGPVMAIKGTTMVEMEDKVDDVLSDGDKAPLEALSTVKELKGGSVPDSTEKRAVDILSLRVLENNSYISYIITVDGEIRSRPEFTYMICGYEGTSANDTDMFHFILSFSDGNGSYFQKSEGKHKKVSNLSSVSISSKEINMTMHRGLFILDSRDERSVICAIAVMDPGEGKERLIDHLIEGGKDEDKGWYQELDDLTIVMIQIGFFIMLSSFILIAYGYWMKKKGTEMEGGVCPKCESRLDANLDFCPSCGIFIRGTKADGIGPSPSTIELSKDKEE